MRHCGNEKYIYADSHSGGANRSPRETTASLLISSDTSTIREFVYYKRHVQQCSYLDILGSFYGLSLENARLDYLYTYT